MWADEQQGEEGRGGATIDLLYVSDEYDLPTRVVAEVTNDIVAVDLQQRKLQRDQNNLALAKGNNEGNDEDDG